MCFLCCSSGCSCWKLHVLSMPSMGSLGFPSPKANYFALQLAWAKSPWIHINGAMAHDIASYAQSLNTTWSIKTLCLWILCHILRQWEHTYSPCHGNPWSSIRALSSHGHEPHLLQRISRLHMFHQVHPRVKSIFPHLEKVHKLWPMPK